MSTKETTNVVLVETELTFTDRIVLGSLLPREASFEKLIIARDLQEKIKVTQDEVKKFSIKPTEDGKNISWDISEEENHFFYEFTDLEKKLIKEELEKKDRESKLEAAHLNLFEVFVMQKQTIPSNS